ncbi:DUF7010 family protein [Fredinandcohnia humi]
MRKTFELWTLKELEDGIVGSKRNSSFLFFIAAVYWLILGIISIPLTEMQTSIFYLIGMSSLFPTVILITIVLKKQLEKTASPIITLGCLVCVTQLLLLPLWVVVYINHNEWIPLLVGVLAAFHMLPYAKRFKRLSYLHLAIACVLLSVYFGTQFVQYSYLLVPMSVAIIHSITALLLFYEPRTSRLKLGYDEYLTKPN